jgi:endonuclease/exonuclease/phosphatase family metal-dependent hydrolase
MLTWNLFHGRAVPGAGRSLLPEFANRLAGWAWDLALLQEVPPWWPARLAEAAGASERHVLTSRNSLLPLRRFVAERWPDLIKSQGGGANAILVRGEAIAEHRALVLTHRPERRVAHGVRLASGLWVVNLHGTAHAPDRARADAVKAADAWAHVRTLVLGGDLNVRDPRLPGLTHAAGHDVDHLFARGLRAAGPAEVLDRGRLSDHPPLSVSLAWRRSERA